MTSASAQRSPYSSAVRVADLAARKPTPFDLVPGADDLVQIAAEIGAEHVRKLRFRGTLLPKGRHDWTLEGTLGATVVQPCVVTLAPVSTRIDETVQRSYLRDPPPLPEGEVEMPEDDTVEPLGPMIDVGAVMIEALTLAMPLYPRAPSAELGAISAAPPGVEPPRDADVRPFAGLGALRAKLAGDPVPDTETKDNPKGGAQGT